MLRELTLSFMFFLLTANMFAQHIVKFVDEAGNTVTYVQVVADDQVYIAEETGILELQNIPDSVSIMRVGFKTEYISGNELFAKKTYTLTSDGLLDEVVVVGRGEESIDDFYTQVQVLDQKKVEQIQPQTSVEALTRTGTAYVQKSQMGGGSPVLRGFEANKILLVLDGVRLNNAIYRGGHLQNTISIDPGILNRTEVLYGPNSLRYGSDALGGVIHFRTLDPQFSTDDEFHFSGKASLNLASANNGAISHFHAHLSKSRWASLTSITYKTFGDLRAGGKRSATYPDFGKRWDYVVTTNGQDEIRLNPDVNIQRGTGYNQLDLLHKSAFMLTDASTLTINLQHSTTSDVPRYDQLILRSGSQPTYAEWFYGPQGRTLIGGKYKWNGDFLLFDKVIAQQSFQQIQEDRISRLLHDSHREHQNVHLDIYNTTVDFFKYYGAHEIDYGFSANTNFIDATSFTEHIVTGDKAHTAIARYPTGENKTRDVGLYALWQYSIGHGIRISTGMRYAYYNTYTQFENSGNISWPEDYYTGNTLTNDALTWSAGIAKNWRSGWRISGSISTAYRAPNLDDLAKMRIKVDEVSIPNLDLKPENTLNYELGLNYNARPLKLGGHLYFTQIEDIIVRAPASLPDGRNFLLRGVDTLYTVANVNAAAGSIFGGSLQADLRLNKRWSTDLAITYTHGALEDGAPLAHIPPLYGVMGIKYAVKQWNIEAYTVFNGKKDITSYGGSEDNPEYATPEGTPRWWTLNIDGSYKINDLGTLRAGVENILDQHYRPFASGVSAPGRNFKLGVEIVF